MALCAALAGCAVRAAPLPAGHPANPGAPVGRTAGAPAALRPGVVEYRDAPGEPAAPPEPAPPHHHH